MWYIKGQAQSEPTLVKTGTVGSKTASGDPAPAKAATGAPAPMGERRATFGTIYRALRG
jgi:hypothetical protein